KYARPPPKKYAELLSKKHARPLPKKYARPPPKKHTRPLPKKYTNLPTRETCETTHQEKKSNSDTNNDTKKKI
ncbi:20857_t:CDS:1, partial [Racocetra persica]